MYPFPKFILTLLLSLSFGLVVSQNPTTHSTYVDDEGVIRWTGDGSEVHGFGINYSTPFAHAYRMASRLGVSHRDAIRDDIYHFARLDFNLYRVHVWDTEISDTLGNLLQNDHLDLFDYAVYEMKKRGMKFVITPIAYWGNGWPEPDFETPGFSYKYGKAGCLTHPDAIKAQENYLYQFLNHVNPYTDLSYKDDPDVIAFEVSNEPHHQGTVEEVTAFINRMVAAMRRTGSQTPVFYNVTHSIHLYRAYMDADVQGGTFQWYPTGLVANRQINGNFLPHVSEYYIPFANDPDFKNMAKLVYEFDAADVGGNYIYPAMARSFREAGMQVATHFDYDAMFLAPYNTNYGTHYMSLPYAPQKALSLKISSAVFHEIPRFSDYGGFPANNTFENFRVDYENDLVELISDSRFFYSNHTRSAPQNSSELQEIAGYGNSPLVQYDGKGAYFLDKIDDGVWRLEVMPDAHWLGDPYARVSPGRQVAAVHYTNRRMRIDLPDLGSDFSSRAINKGNAYQISVQDGAFDIMPGVYILQASGSRAQINPEMIYKNIRLNEFVAPEANLNVTLVKMMSPEEFIAGKPATIRFEVISPQRPARVMVSMFGESGNRQLEAQYKGADIYEVVVPEYATGHGMLDYFIIPDFGDYQKTFPAGDRGMPFDWDFYKRKPYTIQFFPASEPISLWCAHSDRDEIMMPWNRQINPRPAFEKGKGKLFYDLDQVPHSQDGSGRTHIHTFKYFFGSQVKGRAEELNHKEYLVVRGRSVNGEKVKLDISLTDKSGNVFSYPLTLNGEDEIYKIPIRSHSDGKFAMIPRPYPEFKPWYSGVVNHNTFSGEDLETLQVTLKDDESYDKVKGVRFYLKEIWVE